MHKIKLIFRGELDGKTLVEQAPSFRLAEGWREAEIAGPAGLLPAELWGEVPPSDPYLVHAALLTPVPLDAQTFFEVQTGEPVGIRSQYIPTPDNTRVTLVRPSDRLRIVAKAQPILKLELLVESVGGTNELGTRLYEWTSATARARDTGVRVARLTQAASLSAFGGTLHVIYEAQDGAAITLPFRQLIPLDAVLTITRHGPGVPSLVPLPGDTLAGGLNGLQVFRSAIVYNNGEQWTFAGT